MDEFWTLIGNFGFPIVITGYLLIRMEAKIDKLTEAIENLSNKIPSGKVLT
jgi:hypothetical protein